jgi:hypothetical protein
MDRPLTHDAIVELLGAYALDAVDETEAAAIAGHLATCPRCADEVARHHQVAAMLGNSGGDAPVDLWDRIAARIESPAVAERSFPQMRSMDPVPIGTASRNRPRQHGRRRTIAALAAAAAVAVVGVLGVEVGRLDHRVNQVAAASADQRLTAAAQSALLDPQARRIVLTSTARGAQPAAEVVALPSGMAYVFNRHLPALSRADTYQLWTMTDGRAVSVGLLGAEPTTLAVSLDPSRPSNAFAVTVEPSGGSVSPTRPPVASTTTA